jgi:hypothetical protein
MFSSEPWSQILSVYFLPLMSATKFYIHTNVQELVTSSNNWRTVLLYSTVITTGLLLIRPSLWPIRFPGRVCTANELWLEYALHFQERLSDLTYQQVVTQYKASLNNWRCLWTRSTRNNRWDPSAPSSVYTTRF